MDFNFQTFSTAQKSVEQLVHFCQDLKLHVHYIFETHVHADHITGSQLLKDFYPKAKTAIGKEVTEVQKFFAVYYNLDASFKTDGSQFDLLYENGQELKAGSFSIKTLHTPGHTVACYTLQIEDKLFCGDALFAPDLGTGRCDFPGGSAATLYKSITQTIYTQDPQSVIYFAHDYPERRELIEHVELSAEKKNNVRLNSKTTEEDFIKFRKKRDEELPPPRLILPSLLINIYAGRLPEKKKNGHAYLCLPLNSL
jgi:glyoxylase-like metal-dependent hydrolase (beta-lactamase superfamily II)